MTTSKIKFAFFGGEPLAVLTLEKLAEVGMSPDLVICNPDKPAGRNMIITSPPTKVWAEQNNINTFQPESLRDGQTIETLKEEEWDLFVVVSYGKIIPKEVLDLPKHGTINIHPSLLPKYRGPSPIVSAILNGDTESGVTIIKVDEEMDHGPILAQEKMSLTGNETAPTLEELLGAIGAKLLITTVPDFVSGKIQPKEQNHSEASFVEKIEKSDGEIKLEDDGEANWKKFRAYSSWPRTFFFKDGKRTIITKAKLEDGKFIIEKIIPEGGKETDYRS